MLSLADEIHITHQVVVATGKPRGPWAKTILPRMGPPVPGVFMQVKNCAAGPAGFG